MDPITAKHLKLACGFLVHDISPKATLSVMLVPNINDQTGKINSRDKDQRSYNRQRIRISSLWSVQPTKGSILSALQSEVYVSDPGML